MCRVPQRGGKKNVLTRGEDDYHRALGVRNSTKGKGGKKNLEGSGSYLGYPGRKKANRSVLTGERSFQESPSRGGRKTADPEKKEEKKKSKKSQQQQRRTIKKGGKKKVAG